MLGVIAVGACMASVFNVPVMEVGEAMPDVGNYPTITGHGMGDSCWHLGMESLTRSIEKHLGSYAVCIPTGNNKSEDVRNSFWMSMENNIDIFAAKIRNDSKLANGFNAIGFSQGNSLIRGYIQSYNDPPVKSFISVHGTVMGVSGIPECSPDGPFAEICTVIDEALGVDAYSEHWQNTLFQADYYRDPLRTHSEAYYKRSQIAKQNNEGPYNNNQTLKENFISVANYSMIKALKDTVVHPNEGEWWGQYAPGQFDVVQNLTETDYFKQDLFGLKTVYEQGRMRFNTTDGNHLKFSTQELLWWVEHYFVQPTNKN
eukprot:TRINITY_DN2407_c1_g4_i1.p1 TRINITY_DN2407_c1_g4~~TRINITY_DN2407_c1_g4_i1.p1  ORF type:complete len:334 (+),score=78.59 TRINITY_DN2407_c1_g4_i1:58-1002(+)